MTMGNLAYRACQQRALRREPCRMTHAARRGKSETIPGLPRSPKLSHNRVHFDPPRGRESRRNAGVRFLTRGPSAHDIKNSILLLKREQMSRFDRTITVTSEP